MVLPSRKHQHGGMALEGACKYLGTFDAKAEAHDARAFVLFAGLVAALALISYAAGPPIAIPAP